MGKKSNFDDTLLANESLSLTAVPRRQVSTERPTLMRKSNVHGQLLGLERAPTWEFDVRNKPVCAMIPVLAPIEPPPIMVVVFAQSERIEDFVVTEEWCRRRAYNAIFSINHLGEDSLNEHLAKLDTIAQQAQVVSRMLLLLTTWLSRRPNSTTLSRSETQSALALVGLSLQTKPLCCTQSIDNLGTDRLDENLGDIVDPKTNKWRLYRTYPHETVPSSVTNRKGEFKDLLQLVWIGFECSKAYHVVGLFDWTEVELNELGKLSGAGGLESMSEKKYKHIVMLVEAVYGLGIDPCENISSDPPGCE